jgi:hypothetical protein
LWNFDDMLVMRWRDSGIRSHRIAKQKKHGKVRCYQTSGRLYNYVYLFWELLYSYPLGVQEQKQSEYQATPGELLVGNNSSAWEGMFLLGCGRGCVPWSKHDTLWVYDGYTMGISMESTPNIINN